MDEPEPTPAELVDQGISAMRKKDWRAALHRLNWAERKDPANGEIPMLRGICLARLGRWADAIEPLERGVSAIPNDVRGMSNLAAAYLGSARSDEARVTADAVLRLDPTDPIALQVLERLQKDERVHLISFLEGYDANWSRLGWILLALGVLSTALLVIHPPLTGATAGAKDPLSTIMPKRDGASLLQLTLWIGTSLISSVYVLIDILDRRTRFAWLIPQFAFGLCGVPWIPMFIYFWIGRNPPRKTG